VNAIDDKRDQESAGGSAAPGDVKANLPDDGWKDAVTDYVAVDDPPPR
jgi:hypothetical protein